jgi:hypothetical protein
MGVAWGSPIRLVATCTLPIFQQDHSCVGHLTHPFGFERSIPRSGSSARIGVMKPSKGGLSPH